MKKLIMLFMLFPFLLFAQKPHAGYIIQEIDSSGVAQWDLVTTDKDTSEWYSSHENMTIYYGIRKWNTTSDAPSLTLTFQSINTHKNFAVTERTLTIAAADTNRWIITQIAVGNGMYWRLISAGGATNDSTRAEFNYDGYPNVSR